MNLSESDIKERLRKRSTVQLPVDSDLARDALLLIEEYEIALQSAVQIMRLVRDYAGQQRDQSLALALSLTRVVATPEFMSAAKRFGVTIDG